MIPTSQPNQVQKDWRELLRDRGSVISGLYEPEPIRAHHVAGRTAMHDGVHIGHWFLLPLTDTEHKLLHASPSTFEMLALGFNPAGRWDCEKFLFFRLIRELEGFCTPPDDVLKAIGDYHA